MIMMPGVNMPQQKQHRNIRQSNKSHNNYNTSRDSKKLTNSSAQASSASKPNKPSSVTELPETFGLPSNTKKYTPSSHNGDAKQDVIIEEATKGHSPKKLADENKLNQNSDDIEILSENYPESSSTQKIP